MASLYYSSIFEQQLFDMLNIATGLFVFVLFLVGLLLVLFIIYSKLEKELRAFKCGIIAVLLFSIVVALLAILPESIYPWLLLLPVFSLFIIVPKFGNKKVEFEIPERRFDERDVMFSRNSLKKGTEKFNNYYQMRPENKSADDVFRAEPGLMSKEASLYNEIYFNAAKATFETVDLLQPLAEQSLSTNKNQVSEHELADFIKNWAIKLGAEAIGFTLIKSHHIYTHVGRGEAYGNKVELNHKYAIAFTVEMSHEAMSHNPKGPVLMESAQQYLNAGQIAIQLAQFLRNLGYESRAHIDANYRLICPIVAQDAGLGTIGRMGLLMTPNLGPRVRIGVVSTELKLPINQKEPDYSAIHFCEICKKCATNCPSQSIPTNGVTNQKKPKRWTINQESCFTLWCKVGTDCGRCMAVCPYSHPDNFMHNLIRWMIKRNPINRWLALKLDDFFYGRKPQASKNQY